MEGKSGLSGVSGSKKILHIFRTEDIICSLRKRNMSGAFQSCTCSCLRKGQAFGCVFTKESPKILRFMQKKIRLLQKSCCIACLGAEYQVGDNAGFP